jgi:putative methionine-R-sulfoxide reductase with GAF domain
MEFTGPKPTGPPRQSKPVIERRHGVRLVVHSPAYTSLDGSPPEKARDLSEIVDIGEGGMSIQTSAPLDIGRSLNFCLDLSETKARINTTGNVVWSDGAGRTGIRFQKLPSQPLHQLKEWLFVNVLTAFDHARGGTMATESDARHGASRGPIPPHGAAQGVPNGGPPKQPGSRPPQPVRGNLADPNTVDRELAAGVYDRHAALQLIAERALTFTRATGAAIALSAGSEMICEASAGSDAPPIGMRLQASSGFSGECVRTGRSLRCDDSETDDRVDRVGCRALGVRSIVAVPIRRGNRVAGLLEVFSSQPYAFSPQDISVLQHLTGTILSAMGTAVEVPPAVPDTRKVPSKETRPTRIEERRVQARPIPAPPIPARPTSGVSAETMAAAEPSPRPRSHKILLVAAVTTFLFALLWLIMPWISSWTGLAQTSSTGTSPVRTSSTRTSTQVKEAQASVPKPLSLPGEVNDLAGLRKLAEQGDPAAQFALGARYATGEEVKQDYTEAVRWFALAADRGHILAQATLGAYYWAGRGVSPDLTKAYFWSALAQAGGDQASKYRVAVLTSRMSRSQILAAQDQANDWLRNHQMAGNTVPSQ